jgi:hypothetical protein
MYKYTVTLPDTDFQGQIFIFHKFLSQYWKGYGSREVQYVTSSFLLFLLMNTVLGLLKSTVVSLMKDLPHYYYHHHHHLYAGYLHLYT